MLVPTKCSGDLLIWHLLYNKDGNRISYLENTVAPTDDISVFDLEKARHVVGWCSDVKYYAGRNDVSIIEWSFLLTFIVIQGLLMLSIL